MGAYPAPAKVNIGPGHAPAKAQPNPNIIPPIKYRRMLFSLGKKVMGSP